MKFKSTLLTLLVVGLFLMSSFVMAADQLIVALDDQVNTTYTMDETAAFEGVPLLVMEITNTFATDKLITSMKLDMGAKDSGFDAGDFLAQVFNDVNANGIVDLGDIDLTGAVSLTGGAATTLALDGIETGLTVEADSTRQIIVTVNTAVATAAADVVELIWDDAAAGALVAAGVVDADIVDTATAEYNAGTDANVPDLTIAATEANTVTLAASSVPVAAKSVGNNASDVEVLSFKLSASATLSHVVDNITLADGGWSGAAAPGTDVGTASLYIDLGTVGTLDAADILVAEKDLSAATEAFSLASWSDGVSAPVFLPASGSAEMLLVFDFAGTAGVAIPAANEVAAIDADNASITVDGGVAIIAAADIEGADITMVPLSVALETGDLTGPPFSRPNGHLDLIKVTFSEDVDDTDIIVADWDVVGNGAASFDHSETFNATYNGDAADNDFIYIQIDEDTANNQSLTNHTPEVSYTIALGVKSVDGDYALPAFTSVTAADAAPPVPLSAITVDAGLGAGNAANGKLDGLVIQFSEELVGTSTTSGAGITVSGYVVPAAAIAGGAAPWNAGNSLWNVQVTEIADYDTGVRPNYTYNMAAGTLADAAGNKVANFNQLNIPVADTAAPTVVHAKTLDTDDNGQFDTLEIGLSEAVRLNPNDATLTEADLVDNGGVVGDGFEFGAAHTGTYDFVGSGNLGLGTDTLSLPVSEVGSFDTAVMPSLTYLNANNILVDKASTPIPLAAATFVAVDSAAVVTNAAEVWLEDGISAEITSAVTADTDANGKIDAMNLIFSEAMGPDAATYKTMTVAGYTIASATIATANVSLVLTEGDDYDTGAVPQVTYTPGTVVDANGAPLEALTNDSVVEVDNALPLMVEASTGDADGNGKIDMFTIVFSEVVDTTGVNYDAANSINDEISLSLGYTPDDGELVVFSEDLKSAVIKLNEAAAVDTDIIPDLTYASAGTYVLKDMATPQLTMPDVVTADIVEVDAAAPVVIAALTQDDNNDGYLDGVQLTFTEDVAIAADDTAKVLAGVTMTEESNAINLASATITVAANDSVLTLIGTSGMVSEAWDTGILPFVNIAAGNGIMDAADNAVAEIDSIVTTDGAAPVLASAKGQEGNHSISFAFSERVAQSVGPFVAIDETGVEYINIADSDNPVVITAVADSAVADSTTFIATTDSTLTNENVSTDQIAVVAGNVVDLAGNAAFVDSIMISDTINPVLLSAVTMDIDGNGWIETLKLTFDEPIKDSNLLGYTGPDTLGYKTGDNKVKDFWTLAEPFEVRGLIFTQNDSLATIATNYARTQSRIYPNEIVPNVGDVANDSILYLLIRDTSYAADGTGNTGATPALSMDGGDPPFGTGVTDFTPNDVLSFEDFATTDGASAVLMSAAMPTQTIMEAQVSEALDPATVKAFGNFYWLVGLEEVDYIAQRNVLEVTQGEDNVLKFEVQDGNNVPEGMGSLLAFKAGNTIQDINEFAVSNTDTITVGDSPAGVVVEEEEEEALPTVYALGQNFPNPFNPTTTISYDVAGEGGHVALVIYNVNGQKVRTLVDEVKAPGFYRMVWDGRNDLGENVASGVYLYKMVSGSFSKIQKMTFIK